jgi:hypothetical protein
LPKPSDETKSAIDKGVFMETKLDIYYSRLEEVDKELQAIADERDKKIKKLLKQYDAVIEKAAKKTEKTLAKLGKTIPEEVKKRRQDNEV